MASMLKSCTTLFLTGLLSLTSQARSLPPDCPSLPTAASQGPGSHREASIDWHGQLPEACLKSLVHECADAADSQFLDGGSAAVCSIRYEALLRHGFDGDFDSLLRWWRSSPRPVDH